jgi:hypothetical protein
LVSSHAKWNTVPIQVIPISVQVDLQLVFVSYLEEKQSEMLNGKVFSVGLHVSSPKLLKGFYLLCLASGACTKISAANLILVFIGPL